MFENWSELGIRITLLLSHAADTTRPDFHPIFFSILLPLFPNMKFARGLTSLVSSPETLVVGSKRFGSRRVGASSWWGIGWREKQRSGSKTEPEQPQKAHSRDTKKNFFTYFIHLFIILLSLIIFLWFICHLVLIKSQMFFIHGHFWCFPVNRDAAPRAKVWSRESLKWFQTAARSSTVAAKLTALARRNRGWVPIGQQKSWNMA